jgi:hypothetical protein
LGEFEGRGKEFGGFRRGGGRVRHEVTSIFQRFSVG